MSRHAVRLSIAIALLCVATARTPTAQTPAAGASPLAGRWEITLRPPADQPSPISEIPLCILEVSADGGMVSGKLIDVVGAPMVVATLTGVSIKDDQLIATLAMAGQAVKFTGKRVGDHLEGSAIAPGETTEATWVGRATTKDKVDLSQLMQQMTGAMQSAGANPSSPAAAGSPSRQGPELSPDMKAYSAALGKSGTDRVTALQQFLKDFPDSKIKEQASLMLAQSYPSSTDRVAALHKFLEDFPNSPSKDQANLQIATAPPNPADKAAALRKFIADFPASRLKEQAEYQLTTTFVNAGERQAAQEQFIKDHPKSTYTTTIYQSWFDAQTREKPVNEARLAATIDGLLAAAPDMTLPSGKYTRSMRASTMNTVADRLMANDLMLDKALEVIQKAVAVAGDKEDPTSLGMYTTTLGQVQFKLKRYDEAGETLQRAIQISGGDGDAEAQLFLGKFYEVKHEDDKAFDAYLKASELGAPYDTKASLDRMYIKKHGSLAGLEDTLDAIYRAKPKPFEPGHFTRPASKAPSKVVLTELFTGAECVPCVAADLAFDGLGERYDRKSVAVLVYHLHIPGPDPMTNADTEARAKYYNVHATPTAIVDGNALPANGGSAAQAEKLFADYKGRIETRLAAKPLAALADFKAKVDGQTIKVTGQASLAADAGGTATAATLHVALVEDVIRYVGANGIRFHNLVVRKLIGSPEGTVLSKDGKKTAVSEVVNLATISTGLDSYLDTYEKGRSRPNVPFTFKDRVDHLDPKKLLVVAFVQNDQTKEILQSVFVTPGK